jgi:hypothetical protein
MKKGKKKLEKHEKYGNKIFTLTDAVNKARWPQDKEAIKVAAKFIKKVPAH